MTPKILDKIKLFIASGPDPRTLIILLLSAVMVMMWWDNQNRSRRVMEEVIKNQRQTLANQSIIVDALKRLEAIEKSEADAALVRRCTMRDIAFVMDQLTLHEEATQQRIDVLVRTMKEREK